MSMLLRALMFKQAAPEKPNLAVVTDFTTVVNNLTSRGKSPGGVTANLKKDTEYLVKFKITIDCKETNGTFNIYVTSGFPHAYWRKIPFKRVSGSVAGTVETFEVEKVNVAAVNLKQDDPWLFTLDVDAMKGTIRIHDLVITEV